MDESTDERWSRLLTEHRDRGGEAESGAEPAVGSRFRFRRIATVVAVVCFSALGTQVVNSNVLRDAGAPAGASAGASKAAARSCDSPIPGRLQSLTNTDRPGALAIRCVYTLLGRPAFTSEIHCVDGQWVGSTGYNHWEELGVACVP